MSSKSILALIFVLSVAYGCATRSPMNEYLGPVSTPAFEPIVLSTVKDGTDRILFVESAVLQEDKKPNVLGLLVITEKGIYLIKWDTHAYKYSVIYKLPIVNIYHIEENVIEVCCLPDIESLVITDKEGRKVSFTLKDPRAARIIIKDIGKI